MGAFAGSIAKDVLFVCWLSGWCMNASEWNFMKLVYVFISRIGAFGKLAVISPIHRPDADYDERKHGLIKRTTFLSMF